MIRLRFLSIAILLAPIVPLTGRAQDTTGDARAEVMASFEALKAETSYRTTTTIESPEIENAPFDFPPMVNEIAAGRQRSDLRLEMEGMDMRMQSVVEPGRVAARLESRAMEEMKRQMDAQMAQSMTQSVVSNVMGFIAGGLNPMSIVGQAVGMIGGYAMRKAAEKATDQAFELNKWKCFDQPADTTAESPEGSIESVEALGEDSIDGTAVKVYRVVTRAGEDSMEMRLSTLGAGGLPRRMEFQTEQGGMTMDYHDFGAPIEIDFPACE